MIPKTIRRLILNATGKAAKDSKTVDFTLTTGTVTIQAAAGDSVRKFDLHAYTGGLVNLPNYEIPVCFDLSTMGMQPNLSQLPLLRNHDPDRGVGHAESVVIDPDNGVTGVGFMSVPGDDRDTIVEAADAGKEWQLSVGGTSTEDSMEYIPDGQTFRMNNRTLQGPALAVSNYLLRETSFVEAGADNTGAIATLLAAYQPQVTSKAEQMTFEEYLVKMGVDVGKLTAAGLAAQRKLHGVEYPPADEPVVGDSEVVEPVVEPVVDPIADSAGTGDADSAVAESLRQTSAEVEAETVERRDQLETLNATFRGADGEALTVPRNGQPVSMLATGLRERWSPNRFELEARRGARPQKMNASRSDARNPGNRVALLAAMVFSIMGTANANVSQDYRNCKPARELLNASLLTDPENDIRNRAMEQAHDYRHHSLIDLIASAMDIDEVDCGAPKKSDKWFKAAFSSNTVQDLFTQSTQAILLDTYMQDQAAYSNFRAICDEGEVPNFKTNERKSVSPDSGELEKLNATGTASDAHLSASGEQFSISRFAKRWQLDDQNMIDEDFGVFKTMPQFLGSSAARLPAKAIAKLLLTNPELKDGDPWLNTTAGNLRTGSPLNRANYIAGCDAFEQQADGDVILELSPTIGFVPTKTLGITLAEIISAAGRITGENATTTSENVLANDLEQIYRSALLAKGFKDPDDKNVTIAGSLTSWFLFDSRYKAIELAFRQGTGRGPEIRTGNLSNGQYGVWFDVKVDVGAAAIRRESVQKNEA